MRVLLVSGRIANMYFIVIVTLGSFLSLLVFKQVVSAEKEKIDIALFSQADSIANELQQTFQNRTVQVASVVNLFATSDWVSYQEFKTLINLVYINEKDYRRLAWVVRTNKQGIQALLAKLRQNPEPGFDNFDFFSIKDNKISAPLYVNDEIWAVAYPHPLSLENNMLGRAINQYSPVFPMLESVAQSGKSLFSPIMLDPVADASIAKALYIIVSPINNPNKVFGQGFITSGNYLKDHFEALLKKASNNDYSYILDDHQQHFYAYPEDVILAKLPEHSPPTYSFNLKANEQVWTLHFYRNHQQQYPIAMVYKLLLSLGILLSIVIGFIARMLLLQKSQLKLQVAEQTKELNNLVEKLTSNNTQLGIAIKGAEASAVAKQQFMANMSHEIRTPINGIIGMTELCRKTELNSKQSDYLAKIALSAQHLATIINDILDYAKVNSGSITLEERPFSLLSVIDNLHAMLSQEAANKGLSFDVSLAKNIPTDLIGDKVRLSQILLNLCSNAIKFTGKGSVSLNITVQNKSPDEINPALCRFNFSVMDSGIGIAPEYIQFLFDNFTQADASTTRRYGGTGLGLSISQQLCRLMGGEISVTSEVGVGSTFIVHVDLKLNPAIIIADDTIYKLSYKPRVLLLDDNVETLGSVAGELSDMGAEVSCFQRAKPALACLLAAPRDFDFVLVDWILPECNGHEFLTKVKQANLSFTPRIIVITAYELDIVQQESGKLSIAQIMTKPCHRGDLYRVLENKDANVVVATPQQKLKGLTLLVAEDNEINREIIGEILSQHGATVLFSQDGQECIEVLHKNHQVDLILMDIQMPIMDGIAAFKAIRREEAFNQLPIVALTANVLSEDKQIYKNLGMNGHLAKPFEPDKIIACILHLTRSARA
jgi:two-component system sensor histidine kinase/response regulator